MNFYMDIKIRNLDDALVAKLDAKAKLIGERRGKPMSRNELIKIILEKSMIQDIITEELSEMKDLKKVIQEYVDTNNYIIQALLTGEKPEEGEVL